MKPRSDLNFYKIINGSLNMKKYKFVLPFRIIAMVASIIQL